MKTSRLVTGDYTISEPMASSLVYRVGDRGSENVTEHWRWQSWALTQAGLTLSWVCLLLPHTALESCQLVRVGQSLPGCRSRVCGGSSLKWIGCVGSVAGREVEGSGLDPARWRRGAMEGSSRMAM